MVDNTQPPAICIAVLAHNEAGRIAKCLESLPVDASNVAIHVVVNGATDSTASIAQGIAGRANNIVVHDWKQGGKSRSWNRFVFDTLGVFSPTHVFVDGDAEVSAGSIEALTALLQANPHAGGAAAPPLNGRKSEVYREQMRREHGLFGDLYAVKGKTLQLMKEKNIRLPEDLVGDDGLIGSLIKTNMESETDWQDDRLLLCEDAGFYCEPTNLLNLESLKIQYKRMINYSKRHYQNRIITDIMRSTGPKGFPEQLAQLYPVYLSKFKPRSGITGHFDRKALRRMHDEIGNLGQSQATNLSVNTIRKTA